MLDMSFARFSIDKRLVGALESLGYKEPSPIQEKVIPGALRGESMLVQAPTGSGKTHSFLIPIIARTDFDLPRPQAVIVAPSRELARQTYEFCRAFARFYPKMRVRLWSSETDVSQNEEGKSLPPQIVVGTPGRLVDLLVQRDDYPLTNVRTLVLDEADMLFEEGYGDDVKSLADRLGAGQALVYSATLKPHLVAELKKDFPGIDFEGTKEVTPGGLSHHLVDIVFTVDPGRRAYVRRVNITGNNRTRDEVIRREVRQYEAAWFDSDKVKLSRDRIDRLGYFETVTAEPKPVPGTRDQVDLEVNVKERPTGSISLGAGFSTSEGILLSAGFAQNNIFGTGNSLSVEVNTSESSRTYALSVVEPYITPEGISRSYDLYLRRVDLDELDVADVEYETRGAGMAFGIPFTELDRVFIGGRIEQTTVDDNYRSPERYRNYSREFGKDPMSLLLTLGWSRDSRDNSLAPTRGVYQRLSAEVAMPVLDIQYYKATYQYQHYIPLSKTWTLAFNGQVGYADVYGSTDSFPFFKNFYAGGIGSVRGYESGSIGPRDHGTYSEGDNLGGDRMVTGSIELLAPLPGGDRTLRIFGFLDAGAVWGYENSTNDPHHYTRQSVDFGDLRYSAGIGVAWISPLGPLKFSIAAPLNEKDGDDIQRFQFQIGTGF